MIDCPYCRPTTPYQAQAAAFAEPEAVTPPFLSVDEACERYRLSRSTIFDLRKHHGFPWINPYSRTIVIPTAAADAWMVEHMATAETAVSA